MSSAVDLKSTLNLPQTAFPMKANLPQSEPRRLEQWQQQDLYGRVRASRRRSPPFVLHDGPPYANGHIHLGTALNKILKDVVIRSKTLAGNDSPYVPGWDCHGLPIELQVDRDLGSKKREMSALEFRRACRAYAEKFVAIQRKEFERLRTTKSLSTLLSTVPRWMWPFAYGGPSCSTKGGAPLRASRTRR